MRRLPMGLLAAVTAALWCVPASAQHHMKSTPPPTPPGTTLNNTPGPTNRGPGGGGPFGTATVDPRCATSVVCGPGQTAAPGGGSNRPTGSGSSKPQLRPMRAAVINAERNRLQQQLDHAQESLAFVLADPNFRAMEERQDNRMQQELNSLYNGTHMESKLANDVAVRIRAVQADLVTFQNARDGTTNPEMRERYVNVIADLQRVLSKLSEELRTAERRVAARRAELEARQAGNRVANEKKWQETRQQLTSQIASLRARLGLAPTTSGSLTSDLVNLLGQ